MPICVFIAQSGLVNFPNLRSFSEIRLLQKVMGHMFLVGFRGVLGFFEACANFGAEICIFSAQKGDWRSAI